jgi:sugar phosphate isomerase/epimerase
MKYSFMSFSTPQLTLEENFSLARELGYDGLEPRAEEGHRHGIEPDLSAKDRDAVRLAAEAAGIPICCLATSRGYSIPDTVEREIELTHTFIDLAADIGTDRLRVFGGGIAEGVSREEAIENLAKALAAVADHAGERDVTLCIETHDSWCDPAHVADALGRVDHPHIAVNWDVMHPPRVTGCSMDDAFTALKPWIRHVHVHDGVGDKSKLELKPMGEGEYDHARVIQLLKQWGYDGYISGEWIGWEPYEVHLPRELAVLKAYELAER